MSSRREPGRGLTFGFEALTVYAFALEPYPAMPCFNWGSFLSVPVDKVLCSMFSVLSLHVVSSLSFLLSGLRPLIRARISAGLFIPCFGPLLSFSGQHLSCRREPGRGLTSGFEAPSADFPLSTGGFSRNLGTLARFGVQTRFLGGSAPLNQHC